MLDKAVANYSVEALQDYKAVAVLQGDVAERAEKIAALSRDHDFKMAQLTKAAPPPREEGVEPAMAAATAAMAKLVSINVNGFVARADAQVTFNTVRAIEEGVAACAAEMTAVWRDYTLRCAELGVAPATRAPPKPDMPAAAAGAQLHNLNCPWCLNHRLSQSSRSCLRRTRARSAPRRRRRTKRRSGWRWRPRRRWRRYRRSWTRSSRRRRCEKL